MSNSDLSNDYFLSPNISNRYISINFLSKEPTGMITCVLTRILFIESLRERYNETTTAPIVPIAESASQIFPKSIITFNFILPFSFCTLNHHLLA